MVPGILNRVEVILITGRYVCWKKFNCHLEGLETIRWFRVYAWVNGHNKILI